MGCHTWFSVPYLTDKISIIRLAQSFLNKNNYISVGHKKMYQWAIDNQIQEPICELASYETNCNTKEYKDWVIYKDISDYVVDKYNQENGTSYDKYDVFFHDNKLESYSNEPRIGGYPNKIIHSYEEMLEFMKTGYTDEEGKHFDFYYDNDRIEQVLSEIKNFFIKYPGGIITFG